jgi:hypothetical protein
MNISKFNDALYFMKGYRKVALRDTRGVLNKSNNYKFVKKRVDEISTILPSGTRIVEKSSELNNSMKVKYIFKANGDYIYSRLNEVSTFILKNFKLMYKRVHSFSSKTHKSFLNPENNMFFLPDGSEVKHIFDKQGKLSEWERNGLGETVNVKIRRLFNTDLGTLFIRKKGDIFTTKAVSRLNTPSVKVTKYDLTNPEKLVIESTTSTMDRAAKKMTVTNVQQKVYDSSMGYDFQHQKNLIRNFFE